MSLLSKWLTKVGVSSSEELSIEEKATYERFRKILSGETLSVSQIKEFCETQVRLIEEKIASGPTKDSQMYLAPCLHVYLNIIKAIEAPEKEREAVERHITSLIEQ
jgi:thiaminase